MGEGRRLGRQKGEGRRKREREKCMGWRKFATCVARTDGGPPVHWHMIVQFMCTCYCHHYPSLPSLVVVVVVVYRASLLHMFVGYGYAAFGIKMFETKCYALSHCLRL